MLLKPFGFAIIARTYLTLGQRRHDAGHGALGKAGASSAVEERDDGHKQKA